MIIAKQTHRFPGRYPKAVPAVAYYRAYADTIKKFKKIKGFLIFIKRASVCFSY